MRNDLPGTDYLIPGEEGRGLLVMTWLKKKDIGNVTKETNKKKLNRPLFQKKA